MKLFKNNLLITGLIFVAAFSVMFGLSLRSDNKVQSQADTKIHGVNLVDGKADPDTITIPVGDSVQFNSKDGKKHNISLGSGGEEHDHSGKLHSGDFGSDEAWRAQFSETGTFHFHDHYNPELNVLIVVYKPSSS